MRYDDRVFARSSFVAAALLSTSLLTSAVFAADAPARSLVRLLNRPAKPHPLADASGRIAVSVRVPAGVDARSLGLLPIGPNLATIRLTPSEVEEFGKKYPDFPLAVSPPLQPLLDVSGSWTRVNEFRVATGLGTGQGVVVGVVDTGIDVTHPDFRDEAGKSRIAWLMQGGRKPAGLHPEIEEKFGCNASGQSACAVFSGADLDAMMAGQLMLELPTDVQGHGTHVTSIAAGNGGLSTGKPPKYVGLAPNATLVIASPSAADGFKDVDVLIGAQFIDDRATALGMPAVINLSLGGDFGPHDGSSVLEQGLAAIIGDDKPGRSIVAAAGNSGAMYQIKERGPFGIHTEVHVTPGSDVRVPLATPKSKNGNGFVWITFNPEDEVSVGLNAPGGTSWVRLVEPGDEVGYDDDQGTTAAVVNNLVNGKTPITSNTNSAVVAFDGAWDEGSFEILLSGHGDAQLWVVGLGDVSPSRSSGLLFEKAVRQGTIAVPAAHPQIIAVGCTLNRVQWDPLTTEAIEISSLGGVNFPVPDSMCYFSAAGPTPFGVAKPELSAPGGFIAAAMSRDADPRVQLGSLFDSGGCPDSEPCYVVDDFHAITSGSSMSSPHVAGAVALLLELDKTLTQQRISNILQAGARYPLGMVRHETQLGVGALDLEGARRILEDQQGAPQEPSLAKSWWVLSSAYARPDLSWPVWGTIELRNDQGEVSTSIAGTGLELFVTGGVVTSPMTKVRPGLFRFAVAGEPGSTGQKITVDVRYAGQSIETPRELPIGSDVWRASGVVDATSGGCAWPKSEQATSLRTNPLGMAFGVAAFGMSLLRRRSRKERNASR
jgi:subtilisin family serine protease